VNTIPPELLPAEYQAALSRLHLIEDRLLLAGAGGLLLSTGAAAYTLGFRSELGVKLGYAWAAPLPFLATAAVLLALFAWRLAARTQLAALREQAGMPGTSTPAHPPLVHRLLLLPGAGLGLLYGLTVLFSLRAIYTASRAAGTSFILVYAVLTGALGLAGWAVWRTWRGHAPLSLAELRRAVLPFPAEFLQGFGLVLAGFLAPLLTVGLNASQLGVINALFRRNVDFTTQLPVAAVAALGLATFLVIEGLLVPAGRMWQARRAVGPDSQNAADQFGYALIIGRCLLALPLAYGLGGLPLLVLSVLIWLQQAVIALEVPLDANVPAVRQAARARFTLLWGALLAPLRFYAGVLVWVGPAWTFTWALLLFCTVAFLSLGLRAAQRARQARIALVRGEEPPAYDLHAAPRWQHVGFVAASLTLAGLIALQVLAETQGFFNAYLAAGYGRYKNFITHYSQAGPVVGLLLTFDLLLLGLFACALVVRLLGRAGPALMIAAGRLRSPGIPLLLAAAIGLGLAAFATGLFSLALGGLLCATLCAALWAER